MTDTALIERAKQTVKIIEGNYDRHVDLFSIDMQEFGVIHEMLEALEQSQWVSVKDLTIIEDERYLVFDPDQNHPSMIFRLMDGQFIKSVSEDCQAVLVTPPTQESDT